MDDYKGYRYVPYINKSLATAPVLVDAWYYPPKGDANTPKYFDSFRAATEAEAVALAEQAFREWVDNQQPDRVAKTKAKVEAALRNAGVEGWAVHLQRMSDGYLLTLQSGPRTFTRKGIDEAVLEDDWSSARASLIRQAKHELKRK